MNCLRCNAVAYIGQNYCARCGNDLRLEPAPTREETVPAPARGSAEGEALSGDSNEAERRLVMEKAEDDSDDLWLVELADVWEKITGKIWDVKDGETRQEGIAANLWRFAEGVAEHAIATRPSDAPLPPPNADISDRDV